MHDVRAILFDEPSRIARDLLVQEVIYNMCKDHGFQLVAAQCPNDFEDEGNTLIRQVVGAMSEFQKSEALARLKHARDQKLKTASVVTLAGKPKVVGTKK